MSASSLQQSGLSWLQIIRLGFVQTALGAIVVLTTATLNRIMIVEYALPAVLPGALVGLHYGIQISRPRWGYGSDMGGSRTRWIIGGMAILALGGFLAALATTLLGSTFYAGLVLALFAFGLIGLGVGAAGTSLLALLATLVSPQRRPAAASIVWIMMIAGFVVTSIFAGIQLDPYSSERLLMVSGAVSIIAFFIATISVYGIEPKTKINPIAPQKHDASASPKPKFKQVFRDIWSEPKSRKFAIFVFVSMLAYSAQDLILEPFAGLVFGMTPGESTRLSGVQNGGVMLGMIIVAIAGSAIGGRRFGSMKFWACGGCMASALAFIGLAMAAQIGTTWPLKANVFFLGLANGAFAVAAIGSMMGLAGEGEVNREGTRMGLWGAAQAIAFGLGGFIGALSIDVARAFLGDDQAAYMIVFSSEAILFVVAGFIALQVAPTVADAQHRQDAMAIPAE